MNILVVTDLYPVKENEKKTPRTIYDFLRGWEKSGHTVNVIKPNFTLNSFLRGKPFYKSGIYGNVTNLNYWTPFFGNIKSKLNHYNKNEFTPDIVIAHMPSGLIYANKLGKPFVAGVHVSDIEVLTNPIYSVYFKSEMEKGYKNAVKIACRSDALKQKFLKIYPEYENKIFVAYSGIYDGIITKRTWQKKDKYKILTCANLIKRKNVDKVIKSCENFDNIELTIIGDGKELNKLKSLSKKPIFKGHLPHNQVLEEMRNSDIFILPSVNETFGMVYLEAMASGCVTVGLKGDGIDGIIKNSENGYLCELNNIEETLSEIIHNDNSEVLEKSFITIQNYTNEKACQNYLDNII